MKNLRNTTMALLAAGMMAACSSTQNAGLGGTSGTTGMDSGSSMDTTSMNTNSGSSTDMTSTSGTMYSAPMEYYSNAVIYENNDNPNGIPADAWDPTTDLANTSVAMNNTSLYANSMGVGPNTTTWSGISTTNNTGSIYSNDMYYIMNGYQGPLNYASFDNFSSSQSFLPMAAESATRDMELSRIAQRNADNADVKALAELMVQDHSATSQELSSIASSKSINLPAPGFMSALNTSATYNTSATISDSNSSSSNSGAGNTTAWSDTGYSNNGMNNATADVTVSDNTSYISNSGAGNTTAWSDTGSSNNGMNSATATANEIGMLQNLTGREFDRQYMRIMLEDHYQTIALFKSAAKSDDPEVREFAEKSLPALQDHLVKITNVYNSLL